MVRHPLRQAALHAVVIRLADLRTAADDAELRIRTMPYVRVPVRDAGCGIERDVHVVLNRLLVAAVGLYVVDLQCRRRPELLRDADRALPAVRHVRVRRDGRHFRQIAQQAGRRTGEAARRPCRVRRVVGASAARVAEARERLIEGRQRTVERVGDEVGAPRRRVVDGDDGDRQRLHREEDVRVQHVVVVEPRAAAQHRAIGQPVGEAEARLDVLRVLRPVR